ncbi:MAG TPA: fumarylacetoacetate hydrolase family protein [Ramlibacter sp.]|nr:fumarylacetoacetate hydrolase family protein [Ramlibacter sp.]
MKLGTIRHNGQPTVIARVQGDTAVAVDVPDMEALIVSGNQGLDKAASAIAAAQGGRAPVIDVSQADWMAPNPRASKILGCAVNNNDLNKRAYRPMKSPMFFTKGRSALTGHGKPIVILPRHGRSIPEPEPCAVFGKLAKDVPEDRILDHVFGWTLTNDVTASGIKFGEDSIALNMDPQYTAPHHFAWREKFGDKDNYLYFIYHSRSKAADTFAAMGPWITTKDEVPNPNNLFIRGYVNGEMYTDDNTSNYFFSVERVLHEANVWFTMEPGDCIHTGTGAKGTAKHPKGNIGTFLSEYQNTEVEVEILGRLFNTIEVRK